LFPIGNSFLINLFPILTVGFEGLLREVIEEWFAFNIPTVLPRDINYTLPEGSALALVGPRRAGKTYFMYWIAPDLVNRGWPHRSIVYLDFEDVRLMGIRPSDFWLIH